MSLDLSQIRQEIDAVDHELVALLEKRMTLVNQVARYKQATGTPIYDQAREDAVLEKVASLVHNPAYTASIVDTFAAMMAHSRAYQKDQLDDK